MLQRAAGLFPSFEETGGIQVAGKIIWETICSQAQDAPWLLSYGAPIAHQEASQGRTFGATTKLSAAIAALRLPADLDTVVIGHLGLLKLVPLLRARSARLIVVLYGIESWRPLDRLTRALLPRVHQFLAISRFTWRRFAEVNPTCERTPHSVVPLGIGTPLREAPSPPAAAPTALMISRLSSRERYKGHREMIEAWPRVLKAIPDARLWIAGDGDQRSELERQATRSGVGRHVTFWGHVSEATKTRLIAESRCLAMPSRGEGFGLVYLEAMRMGRPCLISMLDAAREVVKAPAAGLEVNPADSVQVAEGVVRLLTAGLEWEARSLRAQLRYEEHFTRQHFEARLCDVLFAEHTSWALAKS